MGILYFGFKIEIKVQSNLLVLISAYRSCKQSIKCLSSNFMCLQVIFPLPYYYASIYLQSTHKQVHPSAKNFKRKCDFYRIKTKPQRRPTTHHTMGLTLPVWFNICQEYIYSWWTTCLVCLFTHNDITDGSHVLRAMAMAKGLTH